MAEDKIDVVNPQFMSKEEVEALTAKTEQESKQIDKQIANERKKIRGLLWLWWFFPIFGWLIYAWVMNSRMQRPENQINMNILKRKSAEKEVQLVLNEKRMKELEK